MSKLLTIGMSTYDDYDGVFFSIQSLRMHHDICKTDAVEFLVLDNNANSTHGPACQNFLSNVSNARYIQLLDSPSSFNKYKIVDYATGKYIVIMDCHVLLAHKALDKLLSYFYEHDSCKNLIQGPLLYDDLKNVSTHFDPKWGGDMYGQWALNADAYRRGEPFEIMMQGMGLMAFEKNFWPGINQHFKGFGGEEGYIAEKFRQNGGKNICLPSFLWNHRFGRPTGVQYPLILEDRIWNYFIGWLELTKNPNHAMIQDIYNYFQTRIPTWSLNNIFNQAINLILGEQNAATK